MEKICNDDDRLAIHAKNAAELRKNVEVEVEDEDDEALSLSDLPLLLHQRPKDQNENEEKESKGDQDQDFDFCSLSKESEMCAADELFFKGRILPLRRHSVSSDKGCPDNPRPSISRSESMDHYRSAAGFISSRSSSISSHQSSSSSSRSGSFSAANLGRPKLPPKARNQFHSHPSPSPRLHSNRPPTTGRRSVSSNSSSVWNVLRLGLVATPPEIAFKGSISNYGTNCRNFGSRNSTSSNSSGNSEKKKKKARGGFLSGCRCDAVDTVASRVVFMKRSASERAFQVEPEKPEEAKPERMARKKVLSHHRTFEWLKQLSIEGTTDGV